MRELDTPRTTEELSTLNSQIRLKFPFSVPGSLVLLETFSIDNSNADSVTIDAHRQLFVPIGSGVLLLKA